MRFNKLFILGLLLSRQVLFASCEFKIENAQIFTSQKKYDISISFNKACSKNSLYKRSLELPKVDLYKEGRLLASLEFERGFWLESAKKFHLIGLKTSKPECGGLRNLTMDFNKDYLTSLDGNFLNLKEAPTERWNCGF